MVESINSGCFVFQDLFRWRLTVKHRRNQRVVYSASWAFKILFRNRSFQHESFVTKKSLRRGLCSINRLCEEAVWWMTTFSCCTPWKSISNLNKAENNEKWKYNMSSLKWRVSFDEMVIKSLIHWSQKYNRMHLGFTPIDWKRTRKARHN